MGDDIVTRLRHLQDSCDHNMSPDDLDRLRRYGWLMRCGRCISLCLAIDEVEREIERLRADKARYAEMLRIKDELINAQVRKIMQLSGVRG